MEARASLCNVGRLTQGTTSPAALIGQALEREARGHVLGGWDAAECECSNLVFVIVRVLSITLREKVHDGAEGRGKRKQMARRTASIQAGARNDVRVHLHT
jgi:hypothetical protein